MFLNIMEGRNMEIMQAGIRVPKNQLVEKVKELHFSEKIVKHLNGAIVTSGTVMEIINKGEYVLDIPPEILKGLKNGTYRFVSGKDGVYAQIADKKSGEFVKNLTLKNGTSVCSALGPAAMVVGVMLELKKIEDKLDDLNLKIDEVIKNFENDRYAGVVSAKEKYEQSVLIKDPQIKKQLLVNVLNYITTVKYQLLKQLEGKVISYQKNRMKFGDKEKSANDILQNILFINESFNIQVNCLSDLDEYVALNYSLNLHKKDLESILTREMALKLDEYFQKSTNPITEAIDDIHTLIHTISDMIEADPEYILSGYVTD